MERFCFVISIIFLLFSCDLDPKPGPPVPVVSDVSAPGEISDLILTPVKNGMMFQWQDPAEEDFDKVKISITDNSSDPVFLDKGVGEYIFTQIEQNRPYSFLIQTIDVTGNISPGLRKDVAPVNFILPDDVIKISALALENKITLEWEKISGFDTGGYKISYTPGKAEEVFIPIETLAHTFTGLEFGKEYTFTIKVVDTKGYESAGKVIKVNTEQLVRPGDVENLTAISGDHFVTLSWLPAEDENITAYHIEYQSNAYINNDYPPVKIPIEDFNNDYTFTSLDNGKLYQFKVKTIDHRGIYSMGSTISATPYDNKPPMEISDFNVTFYGSSRITVEWKKPYDMDRDLQTVRLVLEGENWSDTKEWSKRSSGSISYYVIPETENYITVSIYTIDEMGNISKGRSVTGDTKEPGVLQNLTVVGKDRSVIFSWTEPTDINYEKIVISYDENKSVEVPRGITRYTLGGLVNGVSYNFYLRVHDTAGYVSNASSLCFVKPQDAVKPGDVQNLTAKPIDGEVILTWNPPDDADIDYITAVSNVGGSRKLDADANGTVFTGLSNGQNYTFTIKVVDTSGNISDGVTITAKPADSVPPKALDDFYMEVGYDYVYLNANAFDTNDTDMVRIDISYMHHGEENIYILSKWGSLYRMSGNITGLDVNQSYTFTAWSVDTSGNYSKGASKTVITGDYIPPNTQNTFLKYSILSKSASFYWEPAEDDHTPQDELRYRTFYLEMDEGYIDHDLDDWEFIETYYTPWGEYSTGNHKSTITGLKPSSYYRFVTVVKDASGNKSHMGNYYLRTQYVYDRNSTINVPVIDNFQIIFNQEDNTQVKQGDFFNVSGWISYDIDLSGLMWDLDGAILVDKIGKTVSLATNSLSCGLHTLTAIYDDGNGYFTNSIRFYVVNE